MKFCVMIFFKECEQIYRSFVIASFFQAARFLNESTFQKLTFSNLRPVYFLEAGFNLWKLHEETGAYCRKLS